MTELVGLTLDELETTAAGLGEPRYRGRQLARWIYQHRAGTFEEMTDLPRAFRDRLARLATLTRLRVLRRVDSSHDLTTKFLLGLADGATIETVLMRYEDGRRTVCVSTQVGCGMGCTFCATGLAGLVRNLTAGEVVDQVLAVSEETGERPTHVVFMGMGEPLANYKALMQALRTIADPEGFALSARSITVSTVGLVPMMDRLAAEDLPIRLAVSLHAPTNRLRNRLVPINRRYPLESLMAACHRYVEKTGRRISFEYALMRGVNDSAQHAELLVDLLMGLRCHVNLIPLNPIPNSPYQPSHEEDVARFQKILNAAGIPTTVRLRRGIEINAGCGQLRQAVQQPELIPLLSSR